MPESSLDALSHEVENFRSSLLKINELAGILRQPDSLRKTIGGKLDDLENILLVASEGMPVHIAQKAKMAFKELQAAVSGLPLQEPDNFSQTLNRLNSQADMIFRRVDGLLKLTGSDSGNNANGIIMAQEEERKRISREIHDGPAQTLASLTMRIDYCLEQAALPVAVAAELRDLKESVIRSLKDIRRYIFDLRPMALDDLGLIPTLEQFISGFKGRTGVPVYVDVEGERVFIGGEKELAVFRVIQEAANNAIKHADPSAVHIFLKFDVRKKRLSVVIKDDGAGFNISEIRKNYGSLKKLGLISMEERVRLAGGEFVIVSDPGSGTVVSFWVPLA
jgi:signal transduction histidine kinase